MKYIHLLLALLPALLLHGQTKNLTDQDMTHILQNSQIEMHIDLPKTHYQGSRFDWTGKIRSVTYKNIPVSGYELLHGVDSLHAGKGFYNEFGIDAPVGFDEAQEGEYFHKIGIGLLKKTGQDYSFANAYEIRPADFRVTAVDNKLGISCFSAEVNGYAYELHKEIELLDQGFAIHYRLRNTGTKAIHTNEYAHNFLAIDHEWINSNYRLNFPFALKPEQFTAVVNPEEKVVIDSSGVQFNGTPTEQFYFSNLSGDEVVPSGWELINSRIGIGIRQKGSFTSSNVRLWGWRHVVSPEVFYEIRLEPGQKAQWSRTYEVFEID